MLKVAKFAARGESASILGNRTGFSCNAPGKKLQHTNACSARVEQLLISWRAVALRRRQFLFQLKDLLTERRLRDVLALRGLKHRLRLSAFQFFSVSAFAILPPSSATAKKYRS